MILVKNLFQSMSFLSHCKFIYAVRFCSRSILFFQWMFEKWAAYTYIYDTDILAADTVLRPNDQNVFEMSSDCLTFKTADTASVLLWSLGAKRANLNTNSSKITAFYSTKRHVRVLVFLFSLDILLTFEMDNSCSNTIMAKFEPQTYLCWQRKTFDVIFTVKKSNFSFSVLYHLLANLL